MSSLFEAMRLEVDILEALLNRNRTNHGRTLYYQRMQMVLQCHRRCRDFGPRLHAYIHERPHEWTIQDEELEYLQRTVSVTFPELLSRIDHAAKPLLIELARGFFLPYCTVATATLARLRVLIQRMGQQGVVELRQLGVDLSETLLTTFGEDSYKDRRDDDSAQMRLLARSLGIVLQDSNSDKNGRETESTQQVQNDEQQGEPDQTCKTEDIDCDLGQQVGLVDLQDRILPDPQKVVDHNLDILLKHKASKRAEKKKRRQEEQEQGEAPKLKKEKKKRKKDVFDEIFGD